MSSMDDEESVSEVNKHLEPEMEEEKLEISPIESAEKCESVLELGESSISDGGERDETVSLEDKPVAGKAGEESNLENHVERRESEFTVETLAETVQMPVVVGEEVAPEEGGGAVASEIVDMSLERKLNEGGVGVDDAKGEAVVTDGGEFITDTTVELKAEEEFSPVVDSKVEIVFNDSESQMDNKADEIPVDSQIEMKAEKEFTSVVDHNMDSDDGQQLSELQTDEREGELQVAMEGTESWSNKPERKMVDEENVEAVGGVDNESVETLTVENNAKTALQGDQVFEEKGDVVVNNSEVGTSENMTSVEEDKGGLGNTEQIPITEVKTDGNNVVNFSEVEQVHESTNGVEYVNGGDRYDRDVDKKVAAGESMISGAKMVEDENISMEALGYAKFDEPFNVAEYNEHEHVEVKEELPAGDAKPETEDSVELESSRNAALEEIELTDAEVETEVGTSLIADKIPDEDGKMETEDTMSDMDEPGQDIDDSPVDLQDEEDEAMVAEEETGTQDTEMETETDMAESGKTSGGKRKRGKLTKSPSISKTTAKSSSRKTVGEDVCFICFDGGELVLCDRRGCPKAYHPSCVNRDEAFFKSKGRWNCGWHLCSICEKNARYMCYTCTFSLCRSCIKDAVILCVRGNKGFCETCMRTVMLIENNEQGNKDTQVDFDDRSSWEFLFKDYYIELKAKLSLSTVEIAEAKNPWKGAEMSGPGKQESSEAQADANDGGSGSDDSIENVETIRPKRRKIKKQAKSLSKKEELVSTSVAAEDKAVSLSDNSEWASKELLEFVSHMKDGNISMLSQFDVQALLLEYIKTNKLRDPRRKSQIICDARLENLFGKPRVGHFEMLKLLESHFLVRDEQNDDFQGSVVDTENNHLDVDVAAEPLTKAGKDRKRKSRKKGDRGPQSNLDDYAAIDMHNIGLIYLRRKLMEDLLEDAETFHDKVVGTFVRIRISGSTQKQDLYRLVQVVGTTKVEPYKVGKKTTDTMVEILNLDKTEIISIDTISNQEFTEEECKRLRQSIKCGLISRLTVGEILDKTMEIQVARVNDWLESETLRLSHLRDRASDLGRRKELRECVEKLQLLKTPEERQRRLEEIPEIHADPKMDPSYESDDKDSENEEARRDAFMRSRGYRRGKSLISPGKDNSVKDPWSGAGKVTPNRNQSGSNFSINSSHIGELVTENSWNLERDKETQELSNLDKPNSAANPESAEFALRAVSRSESFSGAASVPSQGSYSVGAVEPAVKINESEKMWHYQDPAGKVQGPFSMVQLRKWNNTGYFPANLRIWRATEKQDNSMLLADALAGKFPKELPVADNTFPATNTLHSPRTLLAGHSGKPFGTSSLQQDKEISNTVQDSASDPKLSTDKWLGNDTINLPSPTPKQSNAGWTGGEAALLAGAVQSPAVNGALLSPTPVLPNIAIHSSAPASVLSSVVQSVVQTAAFSPTPNSQQGIMVRSAVSPLHQSSSMSESHAAQMHAHQPAAAQPVQPVGVISQNLQPDTQVWGSGPQSGQPQGYRWAAPNVHNSSGSFSNSSGTPGLQPDVWRPPQNSQPNMPPPGTPNASWGMGPPAPAENSTSMGVRPENPNIGWGTMQANPNMGWVNPAPGNTNVNWVPPMQAPSPGNTPWVPPPGNTGPNMQGLVPGNPNPGWGPTQQSWVAPPVPGPTPGNNWGPPSGNAGAPPPVQGPGQGNPNQGWVVPPPGNQGPWGGEQNHSGGQFSGQRGPQGRDSGFNGGRPWNRQSSFGGGGPPRPKRDTLCPYNANGRCKKGARCDYLHT